MEQASKAFSHLQPLYQSDALFHLSLSWQEVTEDPGLRNRKTLRKFCVVPSFNFTWNKISSLITTSHSHSHPHPRHRQLPYSCLPVLSLYPRSLALTRVVYLDLRTNDNMSYGGGYGGSRGGGGGGGGYSNGYDDYSGRYSGGDSGGRDYSTAYSSGYEYPRSRSCSLSCACMPFRCSLSLSISAHAVYFLVTCHPASCLLGVEHLLICFDSTVAPMGTLEVVATGTQTAFQVEAAMVGRPTATAEEEEVTEEQEQALVVRVVTRCRI